jgi:hypothetical protein
MAPAVKGKFKGSTRRHLSAIDAVNLLVVTMTASRHRTPWRCLFPRSPVLSVGPSTSKSSLTFLRSCSADVACVAPPSRLLRPIHSRHEALTVAIHRRPVSAGCSDRERLHTRRVPVAPILRAARRLNEWCLFPDRPALVADRLTRNESRSSPTSGPGSAGIAIMSGASRGRNRVRRRRPI